MLKQRTMADVLNVWIWVMVVLVAVAVYAGAWLVPDLFTVFTRRVLAVVIVLAVVQLWHVIRG